MREDEQVGTKNKPISTVDGKIPHNDLRHSIPGRRQGVPSITREVFHRSVTRGVKFLNFRMQRMLVVDVTCSRKASGVSNGIRGDGKASVADLNPTLRPGSRDRIRNQRRITRHFLQEGGNSIFQQYIPHLPIIFNRITVIRLKTLQLTPHGMNIIREVVCPALLILDENTNISKEVRRFISLPEDMLELDLQERSLNNSDISNDVPYRPMTRVIRLQEFDDVEGVTFNLKGIITKFDSHLKAFEDCQGFCTM
ncbi:hypothetical protein KI387_000865, partial [Taxus chinensis]